MDNSDGDDSPHAGQKRVEPDDDAFDALSESDDEYYQKSKTKISKIRKIMPEMKPDIEDLELLEDNKNLGLVDVNGDDNLRPKKTRDSDDDDDKSVADNRVVGKPDEMDDFIVHDVDDDDDQVYDDDDAFLYQDNDGIFDLPDDFMFRFAKPSQVEDKKVKVLPGIEYIDEVENFKQSEDRLIAVTDVPERFFHRSNREMDNNAGDDTYESREKREQERASRVEEATWIADKIAPLVMELASESSTLYKDALWLDKNIAWVGSAEEVDANLKRIRDLTVAEIAKEISGSIESILKFIQVEKCEIPFIWTYRRDYVHPCLTRRLLWAILDLDEAWSKLLLKRRRILDIHEKLDHSANVRDYDALIAVCGRRIREIMDDRSRIRTEIDQYHKDLQILMNLESSDASDGERISRMTEAIESLSNELDKLQAQLDSERVEEQKIVDERKSRPPYDATNATMVLELFDLSVDNNKMKSGQDETFLNDVFQFLQTMVSGISHTPPVTKCAYTRYKRFPSIREFSSQTFWKVSDIGAYLKYHHSVPELYPPAMSLDEYATNYLDGKDFRTSEDVIAACVEICATELSVEPNVREFARNSYRNRVTISTHPTAKGECAITVFDKLFPYAYLKNMPVLAMTKSDPSMYALLKKAEKEGLLVVDIRMSDEAGSSQFQLISKDLMIEKILSDSGDYDSSMDVRWHSIRENIFKVCIQDKLIPYLSLELASEMLKDSLEVLCRETASSFGSYISVGPFRPAKDDKLHKNALYYDVISLLQECPRRPFYGEVMSIFVEDRQPVVFAFVDTHGLLKASGSIPEKLWKQQKVAIQNFIIENEPKLIIINSSGGPRTKEIIHLIKSEYLKAAADHVKNEASDEDGVVNHCENILATPVLAVDDELARLLKVSRRLKTCFPSIATNIACAITLARYVQEPLAEFANLWKVVVLDGKIGIFGTEALNLDLHPDIEILRRSSFRTKAIQMMERELVDAVCAVGADFNHCLGDSSSGHMMSMLSFVSGLGPRKVHYLREAIRTKGLRFIYMRRDLLSQGLLENVVYTNAAGFLRFRDFNFEKYDDVFNPSSDIRNEDDSEDEEDDDNSFVVDDDDDDASNDSNRKKSKPKVRRVREENERSFHPLDNTRIHPECYNSNEYAIVICRNSLNADVIDSPFSTIISLMHEVRDKLASQVRYYAWALSFIEFGRPKVKYEEKVRAVTSSEIVHKERHGELQDVLSRLDLAQYSDRVLHLTGIKRDIQFKLIKEELRFPFLDLRIPCRDQTHLDIAKQSLRKRSPIYTLGAKLRVKITKLSEYSLNALEGVLLGGNSDVSVSFIHPSTRRCEVGEVTNAVFLGYHDAEKQDSSFGLYVSNDPYLFFRSDSDVAQRKFRSYLKTYLADLHGAKFVATFANKYFDFDEATNTHFLAVNPRHTPGTKVIIRITKTSPLDDMALEGIEVGNSFDVPVYILRPERRRYRKEEEITAVFVGYHDPEKKDSPFGIYVTNEVPEQKVVENSVELPSNRRRPIVYPLFENISFVGAEAALAKRPVGDVIFRPSSKGHNVLAMTWKFSDNHIKHIDIHESEKPTGGDQRLLGKNLTVEGVEGEVFHSLDELYTSYARPLIDYTAMLTEDPKFMADSSESIKAKLMQAYEQVPMSFHYCINYNQAKSGTFAFSYLKYVKTDQGKTISVATSGPISVRHTGYIFDGRPFQFPSDLKSYFKKRVTSSS